MGTECIDWTVDIPLRTPTERPASNEEKTTTGTILGRPAKLSTNGTLIRLTVTGFTSQLEAEAACSKLCLGLRYMSLQTPIAVRFEATPQDVVFSPDPCTGPLSRMLGGAEVHGIIQDAAPAVYPTGQTILIFSGGEVTYTITGIGKPEKALELIRHGAELSDLELSKEVQLAIELFNIAGFETSPRAAFIIHCTALEQLFPALSVDAATSADIEQIASDLHERARVATSNDERSRLLRLKGRLEHLKRLSITASVQAGVAQALAENDAARREEIGHELSAIYKVRHNLAHAGKADLGDAPSKLQNLLRQVILTKFDAPPLG